MKNGINHKRSHDSLPSFHATHPSAQFGEWDPIVNKNLPEIEGSSLKPQHAISPRRPRT